MQVTVSIINTLPSVNHVQTSNQSVLQGLPIAIWGSCLSSGRELDPVGFIVASGNYTLGSLESMRANISVGPPTCHEFSTVYDITFQPNSDKANLTGQAFCVSTCGTESSFGSRALQTNFTINGYWDFPQIEGQNIFTPTRGEAFTFAYPEVGPIAAHLFVPGVYTMAVFDEWGQVNLLHFAVVPSPPAQACYPGIVSPASIEPLSDSVYNGGDFNVTGQFDAWNWTQPSSLRINQYTFQVSPEAPSPILRQPQVSFTVNNGFPETSSVTLTNMAGSIGQNWPPLITPYTQASFFEGAVGFQLLFPCGTHDVYLVITT